MKSGNVKKLENLKDDFIQLREETEELLTDEENYICELEEKGRVSDSSENAVSCLKSILECCDSIKEAFTSAIEF